MSLFYSSRVLLPLPLRSVRTRRACDVSLHHNNTIMYMYTQQFSFDLFLVNSRLRTMTYNNDKAEKSREQIDGCVQRSLFCPAVLRHIIY